MICHVKFGVTATTGAIGAGAEFTRATCVLDCEESEDWIEALLFDTKVSSTGFDTESSILPIASIAPTVGC